MAMVRKKQKREEEATEKRGKKGDKK